MIEVANVTVDLVAETTIKMVLITSPVHAVVETVGIAELPGSAGVIEVEPRGQ